MLIRHLHTKRLYVTVISLLPFIGKMNCSAISLARTATTVGTNNSYSGAINNNFLNTKANATGLGTTTMAPVVNYTNGNGNLHTTVANKLITMNGNFNVTNGSTTVSTQAKKPELAAKVIQQSHIICFDVDSTVIQEEGIDELANFCGKGNEVARVTKEAMGGAMTFQDALAIRLNIIRPTQQQISDFVKMHPSTLTRNLKRFIEQLKRDKKQVYLVSGGFDCLIEPVAKELGIPMSNVFANKLLFYHNGDYATFDVTQPTSKSGGKAEAISIIKQKYQNGERTDAAIITMIGDGATDLEAVPPANYFIGFGGNVVRPEVYKRAQYYVTDFEQLM